MATVKFKNSQGQWEEVNAAKLETPRNINGVPFDGSQDITIPGSGGTDDYNTLNNKPSINGVELIGNIPLSRIGAQPEGSYITSETDPTVPAWAKQPNKPSYTPEEVGALPENVSILDLYGYPENPTLTKFLRDDATFAEPISGSGGYAANVYLTKILSDTTGYTKLSYNSELVESSIETVATNTEMLINKYLYDSGVSTSLIDSGLWSFSVNCKISNLFGENKIRAEVFKYSISGVETILFSTFYSNITNTSYQLLKFEHNSTSFSVNPTDRIGVKLYYKTTSQSPNSIAILIGGERASYFNTPIALRHSQLRGFNDDAAIQHITSAEKFQGALNTGVANPGVKSGLDLSTISKAITILDENLIKIITDLTSTTKTLIPLNNEDIRLGTLTSLTISSLPSSSFSCSISFYSGSIATSFSYPISIKWIGTDCLTGLFIPISNKRYNIIFWFDGVNINAVVGGFL